MTAILQSGGSIDNPNYNAPTPLPRFLGVPIRTGGDGGNGAATASSHSQAHGAAVSQLQAAAYASIPTDAHIPQEQAAAYEKLWRVAPTSSGFLEAGDAIQFLAKSMLPKDDLKYIWGLADDAPLGKLTNKQFFVAVKLIAVSVFFRIYFVSGF